MNGKKTWFWFSLLAVVFFLSSCATGQYMSIGNNEKVEVLGTVRTTFVITGSFRYRNAINNSAYIHLLDEAQKQYPGVVDVRDITWSIGQMLENNNYEYSAVGKVIRK